MLIEKVNILLLAEAAYACIYADEFNMDVKLSPGKGAEASMIESAQEMEAKAAAILRRAGRIRDAVQWLADQHNKKAA